MKKTVQFSLSFAFLLLFSAQVFAQGVLKGKVIDSQNLSLPGASVVLKGTANGTVTNQKGEFSFINLASGSYEVEVSYLGYASTAQSVEVNAGQTISVKFTMSETAIEGQEVVIFGDRLKGQAKALNQQKNNANITNVVSSDQIGRFPDANIGDALKRIPGITMQNYQGEARNIIIRGIAPQLNSVTLNGERLPSAEGDTRYVQMD
jgi:hypothetical protein